MSEPKYQRVCVEGEARVLPGDLAKVMRLAKYFNLCVVFPEYAPITVVRVNGRKT